MRLLNTLPALLVLLSGTAQAQPEPTTVSRAASGEAGAWTLRSPHLVWGMPRQTDNRHNVMFPGEAAARSGLSVLVREGFVIGHYDFYKVPAWVCVRWTREDHDRLENGSLGREFAPDEDLPAYARAGRDYQFSTSNMERGHMARHEDNEAWGSDNSAFGCLMSNIVPQHKDMNGEAWNDLENMHQDVVADTSMGIDTVWVINGPVFQDDRPEQVIGNGVAVPMATYKIVGWFDEGGHFQARGYLVRQTDRVREPAHYLVSIRTVEEATGLDFFPDLAADRADEIERGRPTTLWGGTTTPNGGDEDEGDVDEEGSTGVLPLQIASLLPNPAGDESQDESVTIRNPGEAQIRLDGWQLRDRAGRTWNLFGTIESGDERAFLRDGQDMALNNSGPESVELLMPDGTVVDRVEYDGAGEGRVLLADSLRR